MRRHGWRPKVYWILDGIAWTGGICGVLTLVALKADAARIPSAFAWLASCVTWVQQNGWLLILLVTFPTALAAFFRKQIGEPWVWNAIHETVDSFREVLFRQDAAAPEPADHHRVTLFRRLPWWWYPCDFSTPRCHRLIPVERSGHMTQNSQCSFKVPDDADNVEGVAGYTFRVFRQLPVSDLPDLAGMPSEDTIAEYARRTWVTPAFIKKQLWAGKVPARSFYGIPVRVRGKAWGVIILDSRSPDAVQLELERIYDLMGKTLSKLLEKV